MKNKITFCENCRKDVVYTENTINLIGKLKETDYNYEGKKAICGICKEDVYVAEIEDYNLKSLYDVYREKNSIITLEKILEIPQKYNIGKRPLSLLLGWGEMTFSRYCTGDMPTKQYSDILQKIYDDPNYYLNILEENKNNLASELAYIKSKHKTEELLGLQKQSLSKIDDVIGYLLSKCEDVTPLALQKALYYIQGFYYTFIDQFIFTDDCEAWVHGPVYKNIYYRYANYHYDPINNNDDFDDTIFTESEKAVIDSVIRYLCCYSGKTLEYFTHSETPWIKTRDGLHINTPSNKIIDKQLISAYFTEVKDKYKMIKPTDIEIYAKEMFTQLN